MASKTLGIAFDCAAPRWVFRRWLEQLLSLRSLTNEWLSREALDDGTVEGWGMVRLAGAR